jgi:4-oxalocrotonate tautomerase
MRNTQVCHCDISLILPLSSSKHVTSKHEEFQMPYARLTLIPAQSAEVVQRLTDELTAMIASDLGKRHELTAVLVETPEPARWTIGAVDHEVAAHLEVCVTSGTNTDAEKRSFIGNAMHVLRQAMPALATATYIVVKELPAANWGYDGETQAARAMAGR